jgi:hypothetical protein
VHYWELRQKANEGWEYCISNEIVYLPQSITCFDEAVRVGGMSLPEVYLKGDIWLELELVFVCERDTYSAVIVIDHLRRDKLPSCIREKYDHLAAISRYSPMFVDVAQGVQSPQRVGFVGCPSVVRLESPDCISRYFGNSLSLGIETFSKIGIVDLHDRELSICGIGDASQSLCESPDYLIKARPQAIKAVPGNQGNVVGNVEQAERHDIQLPFRVIIGSNFVRLSRLEGVDLPLESIKVNLRPTKLQIGISQARHSRHN